MYFLHHDELLNYTIVTAYEQLHPLRPFVNGNFCHTRFYNCLDANSTSSPYASSCSFNSTMPIDIACYNIFHPATFQTRLLYSLRLVLSLSAFCTHWASPYLHLPFVLIGPRPASTCLLYSLGLALPPPAFYTHWASPCLHLPFVLIAPRPVSICLHAVDDGYFDREWCWSVAALVL